MGVFWWVFWCIDGCVDVNDGEFGVCVVWYIGFGVGGLDDF